MNWYLKLYFERNVESMLTFIPTLCKLTFDWELTALPSAFIGEYKKPMNW